MIYVSGIPNDYAQVQKDRCNLGIMPLLEPGKPSIMALQAMKEANETFGIIKDYADTGGNLARRTQISYQNNERCRAALASAAEATPPVVFDTVLDVFKYLRGKVLDSDWEQDLMDSFVGPRLPDDACYDDVQELCRIITRNSSMLPTASVLSPKDIVRKISVRLPRRMYDTLRHSNKDVLNGTTAVTNVDEWVSQMFDVLSLPLRSATPPPAPSSTDKKRKENLLQNTPMQTHKRPNLAPSNGYMPSPLQQPSFHYNTQFAPPPQMQYPPSAPSAPAPSSFSSPRPGATSRPAVPACSLEERVWLILASGCFKCRCLFADHKAGACTHDHPIVPVTWEMAWHEAQNRGVQLRQPTNKDWEAAGRMMKRPSATVAAVSMAPPPAPTPPQAGYPAQTMYHAGPPASQVYYGQHYGSQAGYYSAPGGEQANMSFELQQPQAPTPPSNPVLSATAAAVMNPGDYEDDSDSDRVRGED
jgi:hypothetical protein